jgi:hypothetical protein
MDDGRMVKVPGDVIGHDYHLDKQWELNSMNQSNTPEGVIEQKNNAGYLHIAKRYDYQATLFDK